MASAAASPEAPLSRSRSAAVRWTGIGQRYTSPPSTGQGGARTIASTFDRSRALDNLTHALVGAAIGKAGAERATPLATATLVVAANAPDIDMVSFVQGEYYALAFRRGLTHGWPALVVLPFIVTGIMLAWDRWVRRRRHPEAEPANGRRLLGLSALGLLTHPSLDWLNIYGMRWGLPFDGTWTYGDSLFIIDPWLWLTLGGAVFLASDPGGRGLVGWSTLAVLTSALVTLGVGGWVAVAWWFGLALVVGLRLRLGTASSGANSGTPSGTRVVGVRAAAAAAAVYIGLMIGAHGATETEVAAEAVRSGLQVEAILAAPVRGDPLHRQLEVRTAEGYVPGSHDWRRPDRVRLRPEEIIPFLDAPPGADAETIQQVVAAARGRSDIRNYMVWARLPYVRVTEAPDGWQVRFGDARYDSQPEAAGLAGVTVHVPRSEIP